MYEHCGYTYIYRYPLECPGYILWFYTFFYLKSKMIVMIVQRIYWESSGLIWAKGCIYSSIYIICVNKFRLIVFGIKRTSVAISTVSFSVPLKGRLPSLWLD